MHSAVPYLLLFLGLFVYCYGDKNAGPKGKILPKSIAECKGKKDKAVKVKAELKKVGKNDQVLNADIELSNDIDDSYEMKLEAMRWTDDGWQSEYKANGKLCVYLDKYLPRVLQKLGQASDVKFDACPYKKGKYKIQNFRTVTSDLDVPSVFYGRFQLHFSIVKDGEETFCRILEADSLKP